jgi:putative glycosyltransferase
MDLSIVTTLYNSAAHLCEFYARMTAAAQAVTADYEIVMVDDGSPDTSLAVAISLQRQDPRVRVVELSRNFGHHRAIMTGLAYSQGQLVFLIDSDLEEAPELLPVFFDALRVQGADAVYGQQARRKGGVFERLSGALFYQLFNRFSAQPIPPNLLTVRIMRRSFVDALIAHREREICLAGLLAITGFRQRALTVEKGHKGQSEYDLARKLELAVRAITSFSDRPLQLIAGLGALLLLLSGIALVSLVGLKLVLGLNAPGYASLMVSVWFLGGLTLFAIGVIGIYLARVFIEVKQRPYTLVRAIHEADECPVARGGVVMSTTTLAPATGGFRRPAIQSDSDACMEVDA